MTNYYTKNYHENNEVHSSQLPSYLFFSQIFTTVFTPFLCSSDKVKFNDKLVIFYIYLKLPNCTSSSTDVVP